MIVVTSCCRKRRVLMLRALGMRLLTRLLLLVCSLSLVSLLFLSRCGLNIEPEVQLEPGTGKYCNVCHPLVFLKSIQDTNSSNTQQFHYIMTYKATCFNCIESSSGLLENRSNVSTFTVHSGIKKAYNGWYSQYKVHVSRDLIIYTAEYLTLR